MAGFTFLTALAVQINKKYSLKEIIQTMPV